MDLSPRVSPDYTAHPHNSLTQLVLFAARRVALDPWRLGNREQMGERNL